MKKRLVLWTLCLVMLFLSSVASATVYVDQPKPADWNERNLFRITQANFPANDAMIIECGGKVMLLDGGTKKYWKRLSAYLTEHYNGHVDAIFNSHPHDDHVQGQFYMLKNNVLTADVFYSVFEKEYNCDEQREVVGALDAAGIPYVQLAYGDKLDWGGAEMTVLRWLEAKDRNGRSGVLHVKFGDATILLTADLTGEGEGWFVENCDEQYMKVDILKAPHHGITAMRTDYLQMCDPELVFVTNPTTGTPGMTAHLKKYHYDEVHASKIYAVILETDGTDWYVEKVRDLF